MRARDKTMSNKIQLAALAVAAATFVAASSAQAATFYDNLTDFNNALGAVALTIEDFEAFVDDTASGTDFGDFTIETDDDIDVGSDGTNGLVTLRINEGSDDFVKFTFDDAITAFRIDLIDALDQGGGWCRIALRHTRFADATCGTIRLKLLKIGALVRRSVRRIKFAMASGFPSQTEFALAHIYLERAFPR